MNKSEAREVAKIDALMRAFDALPLIGHERDRTDVLALAARMLATLVRSTRTNKARAEFLAMADKYCLRGHPEFITGRFGA